MALESGTTPHTLIEQLIRCPQEYNFLQAVQCLLDYFQRTAGLSVEEVFKHYLVRIRPNTSLAHPHSDIESVQLIPNARLELGMGSPSVQAVQITVNFMGLYGVDSPLPDYYLDEFAQAEDPEGKKRAFIDIFHSRILCLFFQSARKYQYFTQYRADLKDQISHRLLSLLGLGSEQEDSGTALKRSLFPFIGVLGCKNPPAKMLEKIVARQLQVPLSIEEFVPNFVKIDDSQRFQLGAMSTSLGENAVLGEAFWDVSSKIRLHLGPLSWQQYESLLPNQPLRAELEQLLLLCFKTPIQYEIHLEMRSDERHSVVLYEEVPQISHISKVPRLGHTSWLGGALNFESTSSI